jgi:hypothetical protein
MPGVARHEAQELMVAESLRVGGTGGGQAGRHQSVSAGGVRVQPVGRGAEMNYYIVCDHQRRNTTKADALGVPLCIDWLSRGWRVQSYLEAAAHQETQAQAGAPRWMQARHSPATPALREYEELRQEWQEE